MYNQLLLKCYVFLIQKIKIYTIAIESELRENS